LRQYGKSDGEATEGVGTKEQETLRFVSRVAVIQPSSWKGNSRNFRFTEF
jgi:hypothetical protein